MLFTSTDLQFAVRHTFQGDNNHVQSNDVLTLNEDLVRRYAHVLKAVDVHYLKSITKNKNSRIEITLDHYERELELITYLLEHRKETYSYSQVRTFRTRRRKLRYSIRNLKAIVKSTLLKRARANQEKKLEAAFTQIINK